MSVTSSSAGPGGNVRYANLRAWDGYDPESNYYKAVAGAHFDGGIVDFDINPEDTGARHATSNVARPAFLSLSVPKTLSSAVGNITSTLGLRSLLGGGPFVFPSYQPFGNKPKPGKLGALRAQFGKPVTVARQYDPAALGPRPTTVTYLDRLKKLWGGI